MLGGLSAGGSIAVNGVCSTVVSLTAQSLTTDAMPKTLRCSNLGMLRAKSQVNLERVPPINGRLGGHFVSGHTDGIGELFNIHCENNALLFSIHTTPAIL